MYLTWLDSNSWLIEMGEQHILLDPWLVGPLVFGNLPWLFKGERLQSRTIPDRIDLILLSQGLEDHAHPPTLERLDRSIPVVGSPNAAKVAEKLGYTQVTILKHGETFTFADQVTIQAVPGSPIGPTTLENGYILTDLTQNTKLYYEPHGYHDTSLQSFAPVDVVITPLLTLEIPFLGPVIKGSQSALEVVQRLNPQAILPTAAGGDVVFEGLLLSILRASGGVEEFRQLLAEHDLSTKVIDPKPGDRFELALAHS
jgi:L-ascorbate metabolism protein UlaG (beta-lactamase superfamily)